MREEKVGEEKKKKRKEEEEKEEGDEIGRQNGGKLK